MVARDTHATTESLEAVFSVQSVPRLYKESKLTFEESLETAVRRVGVNCETVTGQ
jgi:hypothetical protein